MSDNEGDATGATNASSPKGSSAASSPAAGSPDAASPTASDASGSSPKARSATSPAAASQSGTSPAAASAPTSAASPEATSPAAASSAAASPSPAAASSAAGSAPTSDVKSSSPKASAAASPAADAAADSDVESDVSDPSDVSEAEDAGSTAGDKSAAASEGQAASVASDAASDVDEAPAGEAAGASDADKSAAGEPATHSDDESVELTDSEDEAEETKPAATAEPSSPTAASASPAAASPAAADSESDAGSADVTDDEAGATGTGAGEAVLEDSADERDLTDMSPGEKDDEIERLMGLSETLKADVEKAKSGLGDAELADALAESVAAKQRLEELDEEVARCFKEVSKLQTVNQELKSTLQATLAMPDVQTVEEREAEVEDLRKALEKEMAQNQDLAELRPFIPAWLEKQKKEAEEGDTELGHLKWMEKSEEELKLVREQARNAMLIAKAREAEYSVKNRKLRAMQEESLALAAEVRRTREESRAESKAYTPGEDERRMRVEIKAWRGQRKQVDAKVKSVDRAFMQNDEDSMRKAEVTAAKLAPAKARSVALQNKLFEVNLKLADVQQQAAVLRNQVIALGEKPASPPKPGDTMTYGNQTARLAPIVPETSHRSPRRTARGHTTATGRGTTTARRRSPSKPGRDSKRKGRRTERSERDDEDEERRRRRRERRDREGDDEKERRRRRRRDETEEERKARKERRRQREKEGGTEEDKERRRKRRERKQKEKEEHEAAEAKDPEATAATKELEA